jgi:predicted phage tail protein
MQVIMVTIELLGNLSRFDVPALNVRSVPEAIRLISAQLPEFKEELLRGADYRVIVDGNDIDEDLIDHPALSKITIVPVVSGASAVGRILGGIALIGLSFLVAAPILGISAGTIGSVGIAMALGGLSSLLAPDQPSSGNQNSYIINPGDISRPNQGLPVPVIYGSPWIDNPPAISVVVENENIPVDYVPQGATLLIFP